MILLMLWFILWNKSLTALRVSCPLSCETVPFLVLEGVMSLKPWDYGDNFIWFINAANGLTRVGMNRGLIDSGFLFYGAFFRCDPVQWANGLDISDIGCRRLVSIVSQLSWFAFLFFLRPSGVSTSRYHVLSALLPSLHDDRLEESKDKVPINNGAFSRCDPVQWTKGLDKCDIGCRRLVSIVSQLSWFTFHFFLCPSGVSASSCDVLSTLPARLNLHDDRLEDPKVEEAPINNFVLRLHTFEVQPNCCVGFYLVSFYLVKCSVAILAYGHMSLMLLM